MPPSPKEAETVTVTFTRSEAHALRRPPIYFGADQKRRWEAWRKKALQKIAQALVANQETKGERNG
jgi:hypothetical protein